MEQDVSENQLYDVFMHNLNSLYHMENQLVDVLGDMSDAATNDTISQSFSDHQSETRQQIGRLEHVYDAIDEEPEQRETPLMDGLVEEREQFEDAFDQNELRNIHYIGAGIRTERNEITAYEHLIMLAKKLELDDDVTDALQQNLDEEEAARDELQSMATGSKLRSMIDRITP